MPTDKRGLLREWLASGKASLHPLTLPQRELWEASPVAPADAANHICCLIHVKGEITLDACQGALQQVVDRQEVLRLSILPGKEQPVQMIRGQLQANLRYRELSSSQTSDEAVEELAAGIFHEPLDLLQGPLYRAELMTRAPGDHILALAIHHAIADGWSLGIFVEEICLAYAQRLLGVKEGPPALPLTYSAWGAREREYWTPGEIARRTPFWRETLKGSPRLWPGWEGEATAKGSHFRWVTHLPPRLAEAAQSLARMTGGTLYSTLLAIFQIALSEWTGQRDVLVGTPIANRATKDVRETMGYFAGIVPVRVEVDPRRPFAESLRAVHHHSMECFASAIPFAELARLLGDPGSPGHNPVFEVRFALQNHPVPDVSIQSLSAKLRMCSSGTARFHLACEITAIAHGLEVVWLFRPELFPRVEIEELSLIFTRTLEAACAAPESRIATLTH